MKYTSSYGAPQEKDECGRTFVMKDHRIPPALPKNFSNKPGNGGVGILGWTGFRPEVKLKEREPAYVVRAGMDTHPGYTGYIPGKFVG